jgi:hypothetical protein
MIDQETVYDYLVELEHKARKLFNRAEDQFGMLSLEQLDEICADLKEMAKEAETIYEEIPSDKIGLSNLVESIQFYAEESEELFKTKEENL